jgi:hypothetical protein
MKRYEFVAYYEFWGGIEGKCEMGRNSPNIKEGSLIKARFN